MGVEGKCDAEERARSHSPKPRLRGAGNPYRPTDAPAAAGARPCTTWPAHLFLWSPDVGEPICLHGGEARKEVVPLNVGGGAGGGTNVRTAEAGRRVGRDARARARPQVTAGRTRARAGAVAP